ncbi:MAG TPA: hypothetical protein V6D34_09050 [Candidatus Sericytochromatia bacterium]
MKAHTNVVATLAVDSPQQEAMYSKAVHQEAIRCVANRCIVFRLLIKVGRLKQQEQFAIVLHQLGSTKLSIAETIMTSQVHSMHTHIDIHSSTAHYAHP